jgi:hypothetical protein
MQITRQGRYKYFFRFQYSLAGFAWPWQLWLYWILINITIFRILSIWNQIQINTWKWNQYSERNTYSEDRTSNKCKCRNFKQMQIQFSCTVWWLEWYCQLPKPVISLLGYDMQTAVQITRCFWHKTYQLWNILGQRNTHFSSKEPLFLLQKL